MRPRRMAIASAMLAIAASASAGELRATFIGNEAFRITDGRITVLTDFPYESGAFGYMTWAGQVPASGPTLCLFSHLHRDHFAAELVPRWCSAVMAPVEVAAAPPVKAVLLGPAVAWEGLTIHAMPTPHGAIAHDSLLVEWNGLKLFFTGDTDDPASLLAARGLDVAFVNPWLLQAVHARGGTIDAGQVVVYHHRSGERVVEHQRRIVPEQGHVVAIRPRTAARPVAP